LAGTFSFIQPSTSKIKNKADRARISAQCQVCHKVLTSTAHVTSNFIRHLRTLHAEKYEEFEALKKEKSKTNRQQQFDELMIAHIANNLLPLSIVESPSFKNMIKFANPKLKIMCRKSAKKMVNEKFEALKKNFQNVIQAGGYFCTTADIWSTRHRSFFGYTCHWLDDNFKRKSIYLACKRFSGTHSYDAILRIIVDIHNEFGLNTQNVVATTTDNASNFVKAFLEFGVINQDNYLEKGEDSFDEDVTDSANRMLEPMLPNHIRCASHTLNLIATTDFNKLLKSDTFIFEEHKQVSYG